MLTLGCTDARLERQHRTRGAERKRGVHEDGKPHTTVHHRDGAQHLSIRLSGNDECLIEAMESGFGYGILNRR